MGNFYNIIDFKIEFVYIFYYDEWTGGGSVIIFFFYTFWSSEYDVLYL